MVFVIIVLLTFGLGIALLTLRKYPQAKKVLPWLAWGTKLVQVSVDHWGFKKRYGNEAELAARFLVMVGSMSSNPMGLRESRKSIERMVSQAYTFYCPEKYLTSAEKKIIMGAYVAAISHDSIMESLASVWKSHKDLDVRKATLVIVDIMGELVNLEDKLGQQYFQHLIYGLNKSLLLLRDKGTDKRNLKVITSTLFRVYKLSKAYRLRRKLDGFTAGDFYDKIIGIVEHMAYVVTTK